MMTTGPGIPCPSCGECKSDVVDSRAADGYIRRRRRCMACKVRWTTIEHALPDSRGHAPAVDPFAQAMTLLESLNRLTPERRSLAIEVIGAMGAA